MSLISRTKSDPQARDDEVCLTCNLTYGYNSARQGIFKLVVSLSNLIIGCNILWGALENLCWICPIQIFIINIKCDFLTRCIEQCLMVQFSLVSRKE